MVTKKVYLQNIRKVKRDMREDKMGNEIWYDNFSGDNTSDIVKIKLGSLLSLAFDFIGGYGNCWFDYSNWSFDIENGNYFGFSCGNYAAIYDKRKGCYHKITKNKTYSLDSNFMIIKHFTEKDIKRIIKTREKRGQRFK
jgi:hypothetical protein